MKKLFLFTLPAVVLVSTVFFAQGCASNRQTDPPRAATEQLLLSTATDRALHSANFGIFANQKVFLDGAYFDSYDSKYVLGDVRDALSREGALLMDNAASADIIIEARSGGLSTDGGDSLIGVPNTTIPVPLAGSATIPEIALWKSVRQNSTAKIALLAFARQSREHIYSSGSLVGKSYNNYYKFLGAISWTRSDIPEKHKKNPEKYDVWMPQYDGMPVFAQTNAPEKTPSLTNAPPAIGNGSTNLSGQ